LGIWVGDGSIYGIGDWGFGIGDLGVVSYDGVDGAGLGLLSIPVQVIGETRFYTVSRRTQDKVTRY
jgi:hypothetical protein